MDLKKHHRKQEARRDAALELNRANSPKMNQRVLMSNDHELIPHGERGGTAAGPMDSAPARGGPENYVPSKAARRLMTLDNLPKVRK